MVLLFALPCEARACFLPDEKSSQLKIVPGFPQSSLIELVRLITLSKDNAGEKILTPDILQVMDLPR